MNYETRISKDRTKLETVIPLSTPFVLFIEPSDRCNFQCKFCPTGDRDLIKSIPDRGYGSMKLDTFKKIVDDASKFPNKIKALHLFKDGEPLLNKFFPEMIRYAKDSNVFETVDTTSNSALLTPKLSDSLISAGLDKINISIEGTSSEEYSKLCRTNIDFNKLVSNIKYLYENRGNCHILIKINEDIITNDSKQLFLDTFGPISDGISTEHTVACWNNFELSEFEINTDVGIYGQPIKEVLVCPYVFYSFAINSNGTASTCFLDWKRELVIGNIKDTSLVDLWNSEKMNQIRRMFLSGNRKNHSFCKNCGQLQQGMPDDIDTFRAGLLGRIK